MSSFRLVLMATGSKPLYRLRGDRHNRLREGREIEGRPRRLLDIVKAGNAQLIRDRQTELVTRGIHETAGEQIGGAEHAIRPLGARQHTLRKHPTRLVSRRSIALDDDLEAELCGGSDKAALATHQAWRPSFGVRESE